MIAVELFEVGGDVIRGGDELGAEASGLHTDQGGSAVHGGDAEAVAEREGVGVGGSLDHEADGFASVADDGFEVAEHGRVIDGVAWLDEDAFVEREGAVLDLLVGGGEDDELVEGGRAELLVGVDIATFAGCEVLDDDADAVGAGGGEL